MMPFYSTAGVYAVSKTSTIPLCYIAGRFRAPTLAEIEFNISVAGRFAAEVARLGCVPVCVHTMEGLHMNDINQDDDGEWWLRATMAILEKCDAIVTVPGSDQSRGVQAEITRANELGLPVFEALWCTPTDTLYGMPIPTSPVAWKQQGEAELSFAEWARQRLYGEPA